MRNGFLGSLGALLTGAGLAFAQVPYGYAPMMQQPYNPGYGYPSYGYGYGYSPAYAPAYAPNYAPAYPPNYAASYTPTYTPPPAANPAPSYAPTYAPPPAANPAPSPAPVPRPMPSAPPANTRPISPAVTSTSTPVPAGPVSTPTPTPIPEPIQVVPAETPAPVPAPAITTSPAPEVIRPIPAESSPSEPVPSSPPPTSTKVVPGPTLVPELVPGKEVIVPEGSGPSFGPDSGDGSSWFNVDSDGGLPRIWGSAEYLLWWTKAAPLPVPLLTQGDLVAAAAASVPPGALGSPGTTVLSPSSFTFNPASGGRITFGGWLDADRRFGMEASAFRLQQQSSGFLANSPQGGTQVFAVPYFDLSTNTENALVISDPTALNTTVSIENKLFLWGAECNGLTMLVNNNWLSVGALGGIRYLDLTESLEYDVNISTTPANVLGSGFYSNFSDRFATRNQFYGAQLGGRAEFRFGNFFLNMTGKAAVGPMHEVVTVNGSNTNNVAVFGATSTLPVGLYAQSTNIGRQSQDHFAVVPEFQSQLGYNWRFLRVFCGYNLLYASDVLRPGNQIDHQINPANLPPGLVPGLVPFSLPAAISQPYHPAVLLNNSSFWAQGITAGLEIRF